MKTFMVKISYKTLWHCYKNCSEYIIHKSWCCNMSLYHIKGSYHLWPLPSIQFLQLSITAFQYPMLGAMVSPVMQKPFRSFLHELSEDFSKETEENLKYFVVNDSGCLPSAKIEQTKTVFDLLMALVEVGFMQPDNMSKLIEFLEASHEGILLKKVQEFQAQTERSEHEDLHYIHDVWWCLWLHMS